MNKKYLIFIYIFLISICFVYLYLSASSAYYIPTIKNRSTQDTSLNEIQKWIPPFAMYDRSEVKMAQQYSKDSMYIKESEGDLEKLNKIAKHLVLKLHHQLGNPIDTVYKMSPWQQFLYIKAGKSELYCTQYSLIFSFFCRINNLITRRIECFGTNDRHTFNEVFVKESHEWIYNDLTHNIAYTNWNKHYLSFIDLFHILHGQIDQQNFYSHNAMPLFKQLNIVFADTAKLVPMDTLYKKLLYSFDNNSFYHYHKEVNMEEYSKFGYKIKKYLKSKSYYEVFNQDLGVQIHFYLKYLVLFLITIVLFLLVRLYIEK